MFVNLALLTGLGILAGAQLVKATGLGPSGPDVLRNQQSEPCTPPLPLQAFGGSGFDKTGFPTCYIRNAVSSAG